MDVVARILTSSVYSKRPEEYIKERSVKEAKRKKKILLCDGWQWKEEGAKVFNEFKDTFKIYSSLIKPRDHFTHVLSSVKLHADLSAAETRAARYSFTNAIIASIVGEDRSRGSKSFLMRWRCRVLDQLRTQQDRVCPEHRALAVMQQSLERSMLIPRSKCMLLRMRRERYASSVSKMQHLAHLLERCESIATCTSRTHHNAEGCMRCPVIFVRNEPMIRAIDRGNGLPITVSIEHEHRLLTAEHAQQVRVTEELEDTMHSLRVVMEKKLIYDMQAWYACRMANREATRQDGRLQLSLYYFRIRKLARMKARLDELNYKTPTEEELAAFEYTYSDLPSEASEYRRKLSVRRRYIEKKYSRPVWDRLVKMYSVRKEAARREANEAEIARRREQRVRQERKRRRMMGLAEELDDAEDAVRARLLEKMRIMESKRFICHYVDCHKREFKSQQRLDIHLSQHRRQQMEQKKIREMHARNKQRREEEERVFLGRLAALRMLKSSLAKGQSLEEHDGPGRMKFLEYIAAPIAKMDAADRLAAGEVGAELGYEHYDGDDQYEHSPEELAELALGQAAATEQGYSGQDDWDGCFDAAAAAQYYEDTGQDEEAALLTAERGLDGSADGLGVALGGPERGSADGADAAAGEEGDELDPYYDMCPGADISYGATNNNMSKIDMFDEEFMREMDAELMKAPNRSSSDDGDSLQHQYSIAEVVPSTDYGDILGSMCADEEAAFAVDEICLSPHEELSDVDSDAGSACASDGGETAPVQDDCAEDPSVTVALAHGSEDSAVAEEETPKPTGFAALKKRPPAIMPAPQDSETAEIALVATVSQQVKPTFAERFKKNRVHIPSSQSELRVSYIPATTANDVQDRFTWMKQQHHTGLVFEDLRMPMKHLELLSKHPDVECPFRIPLVAPLVRMGTLETNEVVFKVKGAIKKEGRVAKQHVVIYVPLHTEYKDKNRSALNRDRSLVSKSVGDLRGASGHALKSTSFDGDVDDSENSTNGDRVESIVDNHTVWGSYLVSASGVRKVPTITSGYTQNLFSGDLLCIGVRWRGPETLSAVEASSAVMVYRVRCSADTNADNL